MADEINGVTPVVTERRVQDALWHDLFSGHLFVCPNYTPVRWYECDLYAVTKAGYAVEHEIKLTAADFRKDREKNETRFVGWEMEGNGHSRAVYERVTKHSRLATRDPLGPSRFWYVMPEGMLPVEQIPEWAGLKTFTLYRSGRPNIAIVREAPRLHRQAVDKATLDHLRGIFYYRYWHQRVRLRDAELADISVPMPVGLEAAGG